MSGMVINAHPSKALKRCDPAGRPETPRRRLEGRAVAAPAGVVHVSCVFGDLSQPVKAPCLVSLPFKLGYF